jgi:exopolyphosphatase / guanosine-5'-triphosphate,3'-diphosphate pyrophosphatase
MQFPARLAAIDLGSNAIRFVAAEFKNATRYRVIEQLRLPVRLGRDVFDRGELSRDVLDATLAAFHTIAALLEQIGVEAYRAVATSAVRESRNRDVLIDRIRSDTAIELEVISGEEEARLVYLAIRARTPLTEQPWLLVDIGGGSMEIAAIDAHQMLQVESHRVGALRFAGHANSEFDDETRIRQEISDFLREVETSPVFKFEFEGMVAGGGSIDALVRLTGNTPASPEPAVLDRTSLNDVIARLAPLNYEQRSVQFKLPRDRADVILSAAIMYERIAAHVGVDEIVVPQAGVKEGILLDIAGS